jgi:hypothetical protein
VAGLTAFDPVGCDEASAIVGHGRQYHTFAENRTFSIFILRYRAMENGAALFKIILKYNSNIIRSAPNKPIQKQNKVEQTTS